MIRSMTAFSRREVSAPWGELVLELRSVNHRFLDLSLRLPEELRAAEPALRERLGARLARGKVDLTVRFQPAVGAAGLEVDKELAQRISRASREVDLLLYNPAPVNSMDVLRWPGVLKPPRLDHEVLRDQALTLLDEALDELVAMREREGAKLAEVIEARCQAIEQVVAKVRERLPQVLAAWREKLAQRVRELGVEADPGRLEQELALTAQKADVDEELDRLGVHLAEVRRTLARGGSAGRRLDFLVQELNREANTLGSKSIDAEVSQAAVELKVLLEQIREQVQNIE